MTGRSAAFERVENGNRGMRVGAGVQDDAAGPLPRLLDPVDELALGVGLAEVRLSPSDRARASVRWRMPSRVTAP